MKKKLILIGSGGHCRPVIEAAKETSHKVYGIIDINFTNNYNEKILNHKIIGSIVELNKINTQNNKIFIAISDNLLRAYYHKVVSDLGFEIPSLISPSAILSKYSKIGKGTFVNSGAIINTEAEIFNNCIINTGAIIEHEVIVQANSHISSGTKIAGRSTIGKNCFIGAGSVIIDNIKIGNNCTIGAGSVVLQDIPDNTTAVGIPAKKIRQKP